LADRLGRLSQRKKKGPKKKESLLRLPQLWKSTKVAFGDFFLMISTSRLKKLPHKTLQLFHSSNRPDYYESTILRLRRSRLKPETALTQNSGHILHGGVYLAGSIRNMAPSVSSVRR